MKKRFTDGIHDITNDEYHSSFGLSRSGLMYFKRSPRHYQYKYLTDGVGVVEPTEALVMGNLIHTIVLEPNKFDDEFVLRAEMDRRTNAGKLAYNQFTATLAGRVGVSSSQIYTATNIANEIKYHTAGALLEGCKIEQSIYFTHQETGIQCKVRPDAWKAAWKETTVIDLKTTTDASFRAFQRSALSYGYFLQAGMIAKGLDSIGLSLSEFIIIAVEKEKPHVVALFVMDEAAIEFGVNQFNKLMVKFAACYNLNEWPGYTAELLKVPDYAIKDGDSDEP